MDNDQSRTDNTTTDDLMWLLLRTLWRHSPWIVGSALLAGMGAIAFSYTIAPKFTATATLLPEVQSNPSGLLAAVGNFANFSLPSGEQNLEALYPAIVRSNRILDGVIHRSWQYLGEPRTLYEIFDLTPADSSDSLAAPRKMKKHIREHVLSFRQDKQLGVMELSVTVPRDPEFSAVFANALTDSLGAFVVAFNANKASEKRQYIQRRIDDVTAELRRAEVTLTTFTEENRAYLSSPRLNQIAGELDREVQALTAVWVELIKQLEIAKLDDDQERHSLEVLDRAAPPLRKSSPKRASMAIIASMLGGLIACLVVLARVTKVTEGR